MYGYWFRGQSEADWSLTTTLERAAKRWRAPATVLPDAEYRTVREFQRRAHHYLKDLPDHDNYFEWLALIQHYGGPTRLLDVTSSFSLACFFAAEFAERDVAVWCFEWKNISDRAEKLFPVLASETNPLDLDEARLNVTNSALTGPTASPGILFAVPFRLHRRLAIQQGGFLVPLDVSQSFAANLRASLGLEPNDEDPTTDVTEEEAYGNEVPTGQLVKVVLGRNMHAEMMLNLEKVNVTAATLFEGLDGFARSLTRNIRIYDQMAALLGDDGMARLYPSAPPSNEGDSA